MPGGSFCELRRTNMARSHIPTKRNLSHQEAWAIVTAVKAELKTDRSPIPLRMRAQLDKVWAKLLGGGIEGHSFRYPTHAQLVANNERKLFFNGSEISENRIRELAWENNFEIKYFSISDLIDEIESFAAMLDRFDQLRDRASPMQIPTLVETAPPLRVSKLIIGHLTGVYFRIFGLHPYLGGVGAREKNRDPNSPFGAFAKVVLDSQEIRTRTGSFYSMKTIKDNMPPGGGYTRRSLYDEEVLVGAIAELAPKQGRGRPRKSRR